MSALEYSILAAGLALACCLPHGEDNSPVVVKTATHREWVAEQCARHDLTDDEITSCKHFWENRK
jgi:hypothetical protein